MMARAYATLGRKAEARALVDSLVVRSKSHYIDASYIAYPLFALGDTTGAFKWLKQLMDDHSTYAFSLPYDPRWKSLHGDPRFAALVSELHSLRK